MKKYEKEVIQAELDNEKAVLKKLEQNYQDALDEINDKIAILLGRQDADLQHVIYQVEYQRSLKKQIEAILETLHSNEFETVSEYLTKCYDEGFLGSMYSLQKQGVPLVIPIDQAQVVAAIQHETKLSASLYNALGKDIKDLNKKIAGEISRGITSGHMYSEIARNVANWARIPKSNATRIARTEGHRIQSKATLDAQYHAKERGADVVKQWDSSLDGDTRETHRILDGQIREVDEPFEAAGHKAMYPGGFGVAAEDINCRCVLFQRAKWALDEEELETLKERAAYYGLDKTESFEDYKKKYLKAVKELEKNVKSSKIVFKEATTIDEAKEYARKTLGFTTVDYDKFNIDVANMVNKEVTSIYEVFGDINKAGYLKGVGLYPKKVDWVAAYLPGWREVFMRNVGAKNTIKKMSDEAKEMFSIGFWSSNNKEHSIRHETGHAIKHWLTDNDTDKLNRIAEIREQITKDCNITSWSLNDTYEHMKAAGKTISYYALKNDDEFIAESVAEYMTSKPRETARKVVDILLEGK